MAPLEAGPVAIFPWGDVIEQFLDPLGLTADDFAGRMRGGWLFGYVAALQASGRRSIIVYASEKVREPRRLMHQETGAPIWIVPGRRSGAGFASHRPSVRAALQWARTPFRAFARVLRQEGCAAILVQDYEHARFDALVALGRALRVPVHASFQGGDLTLSPLERRVRGRSLAACASLIVASARERDRLATTYPGLARVVDIPNPVDAAAWSAEPRDAARAALDLPADAFVVFNHGRIDIQRKGLDVMLKAWPEVVRAVPASRLVILGSGQDREAFRALVAGTPQVTWIDRYVTDPPLVRRWLSAADAYVTLSRLEGMPVAPLEASSCGLPVVASDAHGLPDIYRDGEGAGGVIVPREDAAAAAAALVRLARSPDLRQRLGQAGRRRVEGRYALAVVGAALATTLRGPPPRRRMHPRQAEARLADKA